MSLEEMIQWEREDADAEAAARIATKAEMLREVAGCLGCTGRGSYG